MNDLVNLRDRICEAIKQSCKDLAVIEGEDWQKNDFQRMLETSFLYSDIAPQCCLDRRRAICNIYVDFCDRGCFPFCSDELKQGYALKAIENHFAN